MAPSDLQPVARLCNCCILDVYCFFSTAVTIIFIIISIVISSSIKISISISILIILIILIILMIILIPSDHSLGEGAAQIRSVRYAAPNNNIEAQSRGRFASVDSFGQAVVSLCNYGVADAFVTDFIGDILLHM